MNIEKISEKDEEFASRSSVYGRKNSGIISVRKSSESFPVMNSKSLS
jgi:hypothetical protein